MVRSDVHAALEIKTVSGEALHTGIEREVLAAVFPGIFHKPIEKRGAESTRAVGIVGDQVVDVEGAAGKKKIKDAKSGNRTDRTIELEISQLIPLFLLLKNARGEIDCFDVWPELPHNRRTAPDLFRSPGERNFPHWRLAFRHEISSPAER
jgi:hypothetical protein